MPQSRLSAHGTLRGASFFVAVGLASSFLLVTLVGTYPLLFTNWLPAEAWLAVRPDRTRGDQVHRLHSMSLSLISWGMLAGVLLQVHRPRRKVAALLMAVAAVVAVVCGLILTGMSATSTATGMAPFLVATLAPSVLHPANRALLKLPRMNRPMLAFAIVATGTWGAYAVDVGKAARTGGPDGDVEHLSFIVSVALLVPLWALIGASDKPGWEHPAGASVLTCVCVALQSLLFPDALSRLGPVWALAALVWCFAYGGSALVRARTARRPPPSVGPREEWESPAGSSAPRTH